MLKEKKQLTTVQLNPKLYEDFKIQALRDKMTFQKLVTGAMKLYLEDEEFRKTVKNKFKLR